MPPAHIAWALSPPRGESVYEATGCADCRYTGFRGRTVIAEVMTVSAELRELISRGCHADELEELARRRGMNTMRESALKKVYDGITTIGEVLDVLLED